MEKNTDARRMPVPHHDRWRVIGDKLKKVREKQKWTQSQVADFITEAGYEKDSRGYRRWENGENSISSEVVDILCKLFEKTPEELGLMKVFQKDAFPAEHIAQVVTLAHNETEDHPLQVIPAELIPSSQTALSSSSPIPIIEPIENHTHPNTLEKQVFTPFIKKEHSIHTASPDANSLSKKPHLSQRALLITGMLGARKRLVVLLLLTIVFVVIVISGGFWYHQTKHVVVTTTDCDDLLKRSQQLGSSSPSYLNDELSQIHQRLQACTLPTGLWTVNVNGYRGTFLMKLDYRGSLQGIFQLTNEPAFHLSGHWNSANAQITFTRSSADGTEVQTYMGNLTRSTTGYFLIGTFTDTVNNTQIYSWSATIHNNPDSQEF